MHWTRHIATCLVVVSGSACQDGPTATVPIGTGPTSPPTALASPAQSLLALGTFHACLLRPSGVVSCWGRGPGAGASGLTDIAAPHALAGPPLVSIVAGERHVCGLTNDGTAYCWGSNANGELGDSSRTPRVAPTRVRTGLHFTAITGIGAATCGRATDAQFYCWGSNEFGVLATGTRSESEQSVTPRSVAAALAVRDVAGLSRACGLSAGGRPLCWGNPPGYRPISTAMLLSREVSTCGQTYYLYDECLMPTPVGPADFIVTQVASGGGQDCALDANGVGYCWVTTCTVRSAERT